MIRRGSLVKWPMWFGTVVAALSCQDPAPTAVATDGHTLHRTSAAPVALSADVNTKIAALRALTAPFHRIEAAAAAGWNTQLTPCLQHPTLGGMGYHYGNPSIIDGTVDEREPELLLYEPQKNGELRLVAVEYIVPFAIRPPTAQPPELYGIPFHQNVGAGLWILHVWHFKHNPTGIFMDWNPNVNCDFAS